MKYLTLLSLLLSASASTAFVLPATEHQHVFSINKETSSPVSEELRLIELSPVETRWVTEDEKLELKRQGINFMDITDYQDLGASAAALSKKPAVKYPKHPQFQDVVVPVLSNLTTKYMEQNLRKFTSFYTRFFKSDYGRQSSEWLHERIGLTAPGIEIKEFKHSWPQSSLIARIPGETEKIVIIGAHQDSINQFFPSLLRSPGADDDGSGTVTILEALRVIFGSEFFKRNGRKFRNTLEFHWYSAEEGGLLGSQAIFSEYERQGKEVVAMLQQDMTGFVKKTLDAGVPESVGVITDFVDHRLTEFIKLVIDEYCDIPYVETRCGYACSDHASAIKAGYPSAFVIESEFRYSDDHIHTSDDVIDYLSFDHMLQHAKLTAGLAIELALAKF